MRGLNFHHLLYFWTVARTGSIAAASRQLFVSQPAITTQIKMLEASLGAPLFAKAGRGLELTDVGKTAFAYAEQIFRAGRELRDVIDAGALEKRLRVGLGVAAAPRELSGRLGEAAGLVELGEAEGAHATLFLHVSPELRGAPTFDWLLRPRLMNAVCSTLPPFVIVRRRSPLHGWQRQPCV